MSVVTVNKLGFLIPRHEVFQELFFLFNKIKTKNIILELIFSEFPTVYFIYHNKITNSN